MRSIMLMTAAACVAAATLGAASAQTYPSRPIRIIVPLAPGGPSDLLARTVGQKLTEAWGQQVIVESRAGANGVVGSELVARSAPDGYTLLMGTSGTHGINTSLYPKLSYDAVRDFAPIARIGYAPYLLVSHPSLPVRTVKDLVRLAGARPGQITWASGGSVSQLAADLFRSMAKIDVIVVPYKGNSLAIAATIAGETSLIFGGIAQAVPQVKGNRLRALAVSGMTRSAVVPEVPTVNESGLPGYDSGSWYGLLAPAGTPRAIVERLNAEVIRILGIPEVRSRLAAEAFDVPADTPEQFAAVIKAEVTKWAKVVKETGARAD
jgi:tripartite-type tricarboxylate transporter receptor subunit TctC